MLFVDNLGVDGMIRAARYARENKVPYLGLCLGMQVATIEFARDVLFLNQAHSTEFAPQTPHPVIALLEEQKGNRITALNCYKMGGEGVRRNTFNENGKRVRQPWELSTWRQFVWRLSQLACLREQLMMGGTVPRCACTLRP